jgi:hypothetical protein
MRAQWILLLAVGSMALGCGEDSQVLVVTGDGTFDPKSLDFGTVLLGTAAQRSVTMSNVGVGSATIMSYEFNPKSLGSFFQAKTSDGLSVQDVPLTGQLPLVVLFGTNTDSTPMDYSGTLIFDLGTTRKGLPIKAAARNEAPPQPTLDPQTITFATVEVGRDVSQSFVVTNQGEASTILQGINLKSMEPTDPFSVRAMGGGNPAPSVEIPGGGMSPLALAAHFKPTSVGSFDKDIELDFEGAVSTTLHISGSSVPAGTLSCQPAMIDFGSVPRGQSANRHVHCTVSGGQYTPSSIAPSASTSSSFAVLNAPVGVTTSSAVDFDVVCRSQGLPQTLSGTIEVTPASGPTTSIPLTAEVVPPPPGSTDIVVTLMWNKADDLDLHLTRNGAPPFDPVNDCYYADKNPDWGTPGDPTDDPFLDHDVTTGYGPEQISLISAAETIYDLWVDYYNVPTAPGPATVAYINVTIHGGMTQPFSQTLPACGDAWHVGTFHMDTRTFVPDTGASNVTSQYKSRASNTCQ